MTLARTADYWFSPSAFFVQLNAAGDRNFIHANCAAGSAVMCYMKGINGLGYDNGHNYKRWTLIASPTAFNDNKAKYVYIAIPKSDAADAVAQFVWPSEKLDIYGYNEAGELIGSEDYFYIWTQGIISASEINGVRVDREWTQMYETGTLSTDEAFDADRDGLWWRWDPITDTVEFIKTISKAVFEELKADFATIGQLFVENDANIGGDLNVDGIIWALQGRINDLRSQNFSGSGLGDTGWWLTNDKDGHSYLEVDELLVRMKATFLELEIRKETFTGGNVHYSPAGSVIYRVDYMTADNLLLGYTEVRVPWLLKRMPFLLDKFAYSARRRIRREMTDEEWLRCAKFRCYMMADDGTTATRNWWQVGDQARCQSFNKTKVQAKRNGTYSTTYVNAEDPSEPWSTDFYWRMVIEVGSELLEDGHAYDYVDFAFADQKDAAGNYVNSEADRRAQCIAGSGIPAAGDTIVCMGNRFNPERMNMVSILSVGADAPAIKGYKGINTFSFEGCEVFCISPKKVEIRSNSFKWILDDGKVLPPKMFRGVYVPGTRYHYYDEVSWIGSIWLCIITDEYFWENRQGTRFSANEVRNVQEGEGNFDYTVANLPGMEGDEIYHGEDHYYKQGTVGNQEVFYVRNYTYSEPADTNPSWLKEVSKGTEITQVIEKYSASKDGINHPPEDAQYWHDTIEQTGIVPGQYLWTRTVTYYSDDRTPTEHYSVSRWGIDGDGIADINSYYWSTDILIQDMAAYERENTVNWVDTYAELGDLGLKQGNYVWEKTQIIYDLADDIDGNPRTLPDLVSYRCNRIGADALIGQEEYYCLRTTNNIDTAFQGIDGWGIPWYRGSYANSEGGRLNPSGKINDIWKPKMPTYSSGEAKYLWNFEWHVSGDGTQWATTPRCIGNHAKGIKGVIELYALSASKSPISAQVPIPTDINSKNTFGQIPTSNFGDPQVWGDERYDRAPNDTYPYQWNWERTLYSDGTHEDHYHISAVKGTKGEDGAGTEFIYKLTDTETAPAKPTNPSDRTADDVVPSGWTDNPSGISFEHQFEWVSQRTKQTGANWGDFSAPRLWAKWGLNGQDGDGVEYVYIRTKTETAPTITDSSSAYGGKQYTDDDYLPNSSAGRCTDDPKGVNIDYPFEWVAQRSKGAADAKTGKRSWNKYSGTMSLWAKYGESAVHLELDNEYDSIIYIKGVPFNLVSLKARLFDGTTQMSIDKSAWTSTGQLQLFKKEMSSDAADPYCQFFFNDASADLSEQKIQVTYRGVKYEKVFTVRKIHDQNRYNIITTPAQIIYNSSTKSISSTAVVINIQKTDCVTGAFSTVTDLAAEGLTLSVYVNGGSSTRTVSNAGNGNFVFTPETSHNYYLIKLNSSKDGLVDYESVPIIGVKNGEKGDPGEPGVGFKKINTYTRQYTLAQWHSYGDGGHTESWSISGYDNSHINVGDSVYLMGKVSDAKDRAGNMVDVACYGVCSSINSSTIYMATTFIVVGGTAGERGPSMRGPQQWDDLPSNYQFYSGGAGEPYVDVVIRNGNYYMCTTTHKKSSSWQSSYWSGTQQVDIVATKLLLANYAYLKNLGAGAIVMYDNSGYTSEDHIVFMAKDGVISCKVGTFENVTVSGTLKGVTGTFNWLDCVDSNGNKVGRICASTGAYGGVAFESVDVVHQGTKDGRTLRFLASDVWVRGSFGAYKRNTAVVKGSTITYYSKGTSNSGVQKSLTSYTSSSGATYYKVPCYPENAGDASGFAVDLLIFSINSSTTYRYVLEMQDTHRMMVVNANDTYNNVRVYANGREVSFDGGALAEVVQVPPAFMISSPASNVLGRGLMISGTRDNDWT